MPDHAWPVAVCALRDTVCTREAPVCASPALERCGEDFLPRLQVIIALQEKQSADRERCAVRRATHTIQHATVSPSKLRCHRRRQARAVPEFGAHVAAVRLAWRELPHVDGRNSRLGRRRRRRVRLDMPIRPGRSAPSVLLLRTLRSRPLGMDALGVSATPMRTPAPAVPAQMWANPGADVGQSRRRRSRYSPFDAACGCDRERRGRQPSDGSLRGSPPPGFAALAGVHYSAKDSAGPHYRSGAATTGHSPPPVLRSGGAVAHAAWGYIWRSVGR